jgi:hypothetical protein
MAKGLRRFGGIANLSAEGRMPSRMATYVRQRLMWRICEVSDGSWRTAQHRSWRDADNRAVRRVLCVCRVESERSDGGRSRFSVHACRDLSATPEASENDSAATRRDFEAPAGGEATEPARSLIRAETPSSGAVLGLFVAS